MQVDLKGINPLVAIGGLVVVLAGAGWFVWQNFFSTPEADPLAQPVPAAAPKPKPVVKRKAEEVIDEILTVSGHRNHVGRMPEQLVKSAGEAARSVGLSAAQAQDAEHLARESFAPDKFTARIAAKLKESYDEKKANDLLADLNSPLAKKMLALEQASVDMEQIKAYAQNLVNSPLPAERKTLVERLDKAMRAAELNLEALIATTRGVMRGMAGDQADQATAQINAMLVEQRPKLMETVRQVTQAQIAYVYRDASDADLDAYVKILEKDGTQWLTSNALAGLTAQFEDSSAEFGGQFGKIVGENKLPPMAAAPPAPPAPAAPGMPSAQPLPADGAAPGTEAMPVRAGPDPAKRRLDARKCLGHESNQKVMRCAMRYM